MAQTGKSPSGWRKLWAEWTGLHLYEKFEYGVCMVISLVITVIVMVALFDLVRNVGLLLLVNALDPLDHKLFQSIFGMIMTLFIAMEFRHSIHSVMERRGHIVQVRSVILIAMLAVARKFIIIDTSQTDAMSLMALGFITLSLGGVYWLLKYHETRASAAG